MFYWLTFFTLDAPEGHKPGKGVKLTVIEVDGGWVIRWTDPNREAVGPGAVLYYTIEKKEDSHSADWRALTDHKIEPEEASYFSMSFNFLLCQVQDRQFILVMT